MQEDIRSNVAGRVGAGAAVREGLLLTQVQSVPEADSGSSHRTCAVASDGTAGRGTGAGWETDSAGCRWDADADADGEMFLAGIWMGGRDLGRDRGGAVRTELAGGISRGQIHALSALRIA